ncbi:MBL fold metallo-hydrolase [Fodinibius halophilus]|uniref:MBL fold metallo-hydrolase n=1 Tax=Fodinibius halophilus TaxID=1736908 RepID=A0A6M1T5E8_9BACT|nr:MBL fold metallo-hydrolase [Fodinibius halophilus]NGP87863.1 MBL fold metallo-hydrolase [Fodinibius halophilus]
MQIGSYTVELLSEGRFEIFKDGHINRSLNEVSSSSDIENAITQTHLEVGINPVLLQKGDYNILLDTGLGWGLDAGSSYSNISNICTNLAIFELTPEDITHVFLSHLHYDHVAGSSYTDENQQTQPTFPNAQYYVHQKEWEYALSQVDVNSAFYDTNYQLDEFYRLVADGYIHFLTGQTNEIIDGLRIIQTGGHTPGHQIIKIKSDGEIAYFLGDLVPSSTQLNHHKVSTKDTNELDVKREKVHLLNKAYKEEAILLFYHSTFGRAGRLIRDEDKRFILGDIPFKG